MSTIDTEMMNLETIMDDLGESVVETQRPCKFIYKSIEAMKLADRASSKVQMLALEMHMTLWR